MVCIRTKNGKGIVTKAHPYLTTQHIADTYLAVLLYATYKECRPYLQNVTPDR